MKSRTGCCVRSLPLSQEKHATENVDYDDQDRSRKFEVSELESMMQ
jgi:hypothetical protein